MSEVSKKEDAETKSILINTVSGAIDSINRVTPREIGDIKTKAKETLGAGLDKLKELINSIEK